MLRRIETVENIPGFIEGVKNGEERLMGFGHRVYKNYDPRARIIKKHVDEVFEATGDNPLLDIALELEKRALDDEYFISRKLYPNVDFYSGLIYEALGIPTDMFTVLFAIPRTAGWVAQWLEMIDDPEQKIARPRQIYTGAASATTCRSAPASPNRRRRGPPPLGGRGAPAVRSATWSSRSTRRASSPSSSASQRRSIRTVPPRHRLLGEVGALGGEVGVDHPAVARVFQALDEPAALEAVHQLGHVGAGHAELVAERVEAGAVLLDWQQSTSRTSSFASERPKSPAWRSSSRPALQATFSRASVARRARSERSGGSSIVSRCIISEVPPRLAGRQGAREARVSPHDRTNRTSCDRPPATWPPSSSA